MRFLSLLVRLLTWAAPLAFARAGGGGHYSGGGHSGGFSGGSYSSGGGGGGADITWLVIAYFQMVGAHPLIGVPVTILILYAVYRFNAAYGDAFVGAGRMSDVIAQGADFQDGARMREVLGRLKARDPGFDLEGFEKRVAGAFLAIQDAWSKQDMAPARAFISDGVMERFSIQIAMQKADGLRNKLDQVQVLAAKAIELESDPQFDTLHLRVAASAVDQDVSLEDGRVLSGASSPEDFVEIWSFLRRPGAKTSKGPGLIEGFCPSCGAPLAIADAAQCGACKTWVNSGQYDWVLCEITQECEWAVRGGGEAVPGFSELSRADPGLNTQFLEDRASVAFWRWQLAFAEGSSAALRCAAVEEFCKTFDAEYAELSACYRDQAVGAVEVLAVETGNPMDRAHVSVKWSGEWFKVMDGELSSQGHVARQHVLILARKSGVKTDPRAGLRSGRCAACGAPPTSREADRCEYCSAPFNDGSRHWVLEAAVPIGLWKRPSLAEGAAATLDFDWATGLSSAEVLAVLVSAMMADGRAGPEEEAYLSAYARQNGVEPALLSGLLEAAKSGQLRVPAPKTPGEAVACLKGFVEMSLADGRISDEELKVLKSFGASAGLSDAQVEALVAEQRKLLYRRAKQALSASA